MSSFPDWKKYIVPQKRLQSGCVPWGYEILLRTAKIKGVDFGIFQDEFDLDKNGPINGLSYNGFGNVSRAVHKKYPNIKFGVKNFQKGDGDKKLKFVEKSLAQKQPILISLPNPPFTKRQWHTYLVVDSNEENLVLLSGVDQNGNPITKEIKKTEIVRMHDFEEGGEDIAYLE